MKKKKSLSTIESKDLYILGYSGHAYTVIDVALSNGFLVKGYFDKEKTDSNPYALNFLGDERKSNIQEITENGYVFAAIGHNDIRRKILNFIETNNLNQTILVDKCARVSQTAKIGVATLVAPNVFINSMARIGKGCIINSGAIIEHECSIGDFTHIAPGAVLAGNVTVGTNVFLGANCVIKQGITIGNNSIVGAGAVVLRDVPEGETWAGNPAKVLE